MANEVTNETENTPQPSVPVSEQTNNSVETSAEENQATPQQQTAPTQQTASTEQAADDGKNISASQTASSETPASTEEDFGSILEKFEQEQSIYHTGDLVEGTVVGVSERGVLIDFGYKSEGIAPIEDFTAPTGEVSVEKGDAVEVIIKSISSGDAPPTLSRADALSRKSWDAIEKAYNENMPITGRVVEVTKGGLQIDLDGVEAFMPGSQVDSRPIRNLNSYVGQDIEAQVIKFSRKRNNIVLSRKVLTDEIVNQQKSETLGNIEEGYIVEGTIKNLTEYGAFVDIGGIDGLLHVTDMSWGRLQNPGDQFKVGDTIQVKVLKLDRDKEKVALGYKQLIPDPWSTVIELYPVNSKVKGRVSSVAEYGAFIELEPGVEGLVHVSEMSWSKRSANPKKLVRPGDELEVQVLGVDTDDRRISLGMKQLQPNPWQTVRERFQIGQTVRGRVRNLTDFGAFVELEDGIDGLVHVSDISHSKKIKHPKDVLKRDQEVEAVIKNIDPQNRRISLSIKELTPSTWEQFVATHKPGDVVRGKISRFTGFGVFVELGNELEGLCHISELSDERVERPEDIGEIGQEMDFKILRIEPDTQKIGLSHRAVGKADEPVVDTKSYSTEAKGGMASLGELMNLKRGAGTEEEKPEEPRLSKKERKARQAQERAEQESKLAEEQVANAPQETSETNASENQTSETDANSETASDDTSSSENAETTNEASEQNQSSAETPTDDESVAGSPNASQTTEASSESESKTENQTEVSEPKAEAVETAASEQENSDTAKSETDTASDTAAQTETENAAVPQLNDTDGEAATVAENSGENVSAPLDEAKSDAPKAEASDKTSEEKTANG
ncbi:MAG: S1 RNA-binding domain-containing protein [Pyrinomonadaceae bacterium]